MGLKINRGLMIQKFDMGLNNQSGTRDLGLKINQVSHHHVGLAIVEENLDVRARSEKLLVSALRLYDVCSLAR